MPLLSQGVFALATDDVMFESSASDLPPGPPPDVHALDLSMASRGIVAHSGKNVDLALNVTCIGIDVRDGVRASPSSGRHECFAGPGDQAGHGNPEAFPGWAIDVGGPLHVAGPTQSAVPRHALQRV